MKSQVEIRKNTYYDSVTLMLISKEIKQLSGVKEAIVGMGTELNKELTRNLNIKSGKMKELEPNDFFVAVLLEDHINMDNIIDVVDKLLSDKKNNTASDYRPVTLDSAMKYEPESNLVLISLPGQFAAKEAKKALNNGLHVMLFSDNVSLQEEKELKLLADEKGLLMMGPDCGTAIINNTPLAFANVVSQGPIGIVGASGTGTQEVSVLIDKLGSGVSQVIGTGGRDLSSDIGGIMMLQGLQALIKDPATEVIILISKPPASWVAEKILKEVAKSPKPVVVDFIGGDRELIKKYGAYPCISLEDTAHKALALVEKEAVIDFIGFSDSDDKINHLINHEVEKLDASQKYLRGLYTGGTLADEAMKLLSKDIGDIYSNIPLKSEYRLKEISRSTKHTCIDLGDDVFTVGRPHPMIDPSTRVDRLLKEAEDEEVAVILMDFVLGYGSHEDPIGEMLPAINQAKDSMRNKGKYVSIIASICGTDKDPQNLMMSKEKLEKAGVIVMPSNAQAVRLTSKILARIGLKV